MISAELESGQNTSCASSGVKLWKIPFPCTLVHALSMIFMVVAMYRKPSINTANGSCMFSVLFEFVLIEVKNKWDKL